MSSGTNNNEIDYTGYAKFFAENIQYRLDSEGVTVYEGMSLTDFCKWWLDNSDRHEQDFRRFLNKFANNKADLETANKLEQIGVNIEVESFYFLCRFVKEIVAGHYFCLLKPQIKDTLKELDDIDTIMFTSKDGSHTESRHSKLIDIVRSAIANNTDSDSTEYEVEKWVKTEDISNKIAVNSKFANYMIMFLSSYFPNAKRRANSGTIDTAEQSLVCKALFALDMTPAVISSARYRQMKMYYTKIKTNASHIIIGGKLFPITFVKYEDWHNKKVDWTAIDAPLTPLKVGESVSF